MKTALLLGFATAGLLYGGEPVVVEPLGLSGRDMARPGIPVVGGQPVKIEVAVEAPADTKFTVYADIKQVARELVAPLQTDVPLGSELNFKTAERRKVTVEIPLPEVKQPAFLRVEFKAGVKGPTAGQVSFIVFPKRVPGELASALEAAEKSGGIRLAIFGQSPALRAFFRDQKIAFEDLGEEFPRDFSPQKLVLGEVTEVDLEKRRPPGSSGRTIFFTGGTRLPAGVYQTLTPGGSQTKVTLPLLSDLTANPQNQNLLVDLLKHQLDPADSTTTP